MKPPPGGTRSPEVKNRGARLATTAGAVAFSRASSKPLGLPLPAAMSRSARKSPPFWIFECRSDKKCAYSDASVVSVQTSA